jgi:cyclic pyranopterin phosphate synthase
MGPVSPFSHVGPDGAARMVDVGGKAESVRSATAEAVVDVGATVAEMLAATGAVAKGNVVETARIAGILAAKRTAELIPMCHPLAIDAVDVRCRLDGPAVVIHADVRCTGKTGVEMEAMTAATVAALTVYDMCKSASKGIVIRHVRLLEKTGGKSGTWRVEDGAAAERPDC